MWSENGIASEKQPIRGAQCQAGPARRRGRLGRIAVRRQRHRAAEEVEATVEEVFEAGAVDLRIATAVDRDVLVALEMRTVEVGDLGQTAASFLCTSGRQDDADDVSAPGRIEHHVVLAVRLDARRV